MLEQFRIRSTRGVPLGTQRELHPPPHRELFEKINE